MIAIVLYTYIGYGIVLYFLVKLKRLFKKSTPAENMERYEPEVTLFIAAYNEKDYVADKMKNTLGLDYPKEKLRIVWVTDGSDDGTPELLKQYKEAIVLHENGRNGKIGAMNRGMKLVNTPIVIFSDAIPCWAKNQSAGLSVYLKPQP